MTKKEETDQLAAGRLFVRAAVIPTTVVGNQNVLCASRCKSWRKRCHEDGITAHDVMYNCTSNVGRIILESASLMQTE